MGQKSTKSPDNETNKRPRGLSTSESLAAIRSEEQRLKELNINRAALADVLQINLRALLARIEYDQKCKLAERRRRVAEEILSTEQSYVESLRVILEVFGGELIKQKLADDAQLRLMFPELRTLLNFNGDLCAQLEAKLADWHWTSCLGPTLLKLIPYLKSYTTYVNQFPAAQALLKRRATEDEQFAAALERASANPRCKKNDLDSLMIMPVQRVPRYVLLFDDLLRCTPAGHCDHDALTDAVAQVRKVATVINESKKHADNAQKLIEIYGVLTPPIDDLVQPHRSVLCRGSLADFSDQAKHPHGKMYIFFLFSDLLIKAGEKTDKHGRHTVKLTVDLAGCAVASIPDNGRVRNAICLTKTNSTPRPFSLVLSCKTPEGTAKWLGLFNKALADVLARQKSFVRRDEHVAATTSDSEPSRASTKAATTATSVPLSRHSTSAAITVKMTDSRPQKTHKQPSHTAPIPSGVVASAPPPTRSNTIADLRQTKPTTKASKPKY
jgi:hypothetical protein